MKSRDKITLDLFATIPQQPDILSGIVDFKVKLAVAMSHALKASRHDRYEVATRMSRILGRDVTKMMIDAYCASSKDTHIPNLQWCIAFDAATEMHELLNLFAALSGCSVLAGAETLRAQLGHLEVEEQRIREKRTALKSYLMGIARDQ